MPKTEAQKKAQLKYIENHKETYYLKQRERALNYYYAHKAEILEKKKEYYINKKQNSENPENI